MKYTIAMDHCGFYYLIRIQTILWLSELAELFFKIRTQLRAEPNWDDLVRSAILFGFQKMFRKFGPTQKSFFFIAIGTGEDFRIEFRAKKSGPYK